MLRKCRHGLSLPLRDASVNSQAVLHVGVSIKRRRGGVDQHACRCLNYQNMDADVQLDGGVHDLELEDIVREHYEKDEELVDDSDFDEDFDDQMREDIS